MSAEPRATEALIADAHALAPKARDLVQAMSAGNARWRMSIPADTERDYDVVVWNLARTAEELATALEQAEKVSRWAVKRLEAVVAANSGRQHMGQRHNTKRVTRDVICALEGRKLVSAEATA